MIVLLAWTEAKYGVSDVFSSIRIVGNGCFIPGLEFNEGCVFIGGEESRESPIGRCDRFIGRS